MNDPLIFNQLEIVILVLGVLFLIGFVAWTVRMVMKPAVLITIFAVLGWLLYLNTM